MDGVSLKARAMRETGLADFGPAPLDDGLDMLCRALRDEAGLSDAGEAAMTRSLVATLSERLRVEDWLAREPSILDRPLAPQLFVLGLPRSGTTALSQFISEDPAARSIRRWELNSLTPPPDDDGADPDPRIGATKRAFAARDAAMPGFKAMLPLTATDPSEHGVLLGLTFRNLHWSSLNHIPAYTDWVMGADMDAGFAYLGRILHLLQWKTRAGYWNLKNPVDSFAIDALLRSFPDAHALWMHRDPAKTIASVCSLLCFLREAAGERFDREQYCAYILEFEAGLIDRAMAKRAALPDPTRVIDVHNADLARDPIAALRTAFAATGRPLSTAFEAGLAQRLVDRPRGGHGAHGYSAAGFGLDPDRIRARFATYIDRFGIALEN